MIVGMYTRRDFGKLALAAPLAAAGARRASAVTMIDSRVDGVMIGVQTYSFRDRDLDACIAAMKEIPLGYMELWQGHIEPKDPAAAKAWRANPPLDDLKAVRQKIADAGITLYAVNYSFREEFTDAEIENGFKIAQALGTDKITASANVSTSPRIDKYATQYNTYVGFHNHDSMKPNEFSTPDDWDKALEGRSKYMCINLDIGHFTAAGFDPVKFLEKNHAKILTLHLKDRQRGHGANLPFGEGETNIKGVMRVLEKKKYPIPANIEYEYGAGKMDSLAEVKKCYAYVKFVMT